MWKIFYGDGSTYSDKDGLPELAPKRDVQIIGADCEIAGRRFERETDYYIWTPERGGWRGVDKFGLFDYLIDSGYKIVLFGKMLNNKEYRKILDKATNDSYLPRKSAWLREERRP